MSIDTRSLHCYVSRLLRERLARDVTRTVPAADDVPVAVLLSDLQGFTALVERFSREGRAGLEELTWALNSFFADLADIVDSRGGDVVSIAGDAFLCVWAAESIEARVKMVRVQGDQSAFKTDYEPGNPSAGADGYVKMPNVNSLVEALDMREAQRAYEANLNVIETARAMEMRTLDLLKK